MIIGIYRIYNRETGRSYIGQSIHVEQRLLSHLNSLESGSHPNYMLQTDFDDSGEECFGAEILEECLSFELDEKEASWIEAFDSERTGYNLTHITKTKKRKLPAISIEEDLYIRMKEYIAHNNITISAFIRYLLEDHLDRNS